MTNGPCSTLASVLTLSLGLIACATEDETPLASLEQPVLLEKEGVYYDVELTPTGSRALAMQAEAVTVANLELGTITIQEPGDTSSNPATRTVPFLGSCGLTFVSEHYAITAGHCLTQADPDLPVEVRVIRPQPNFNWQSTTTISGTFPHFKHRWEKGTAAGRSRYGSKSFSCALKVRCYVDPNRGVEHHNCNIGMDDVGFAASSDQEVRDASDVALVYCNEPLGKRYGMVEVAQEDLPGTDLLMPWFHEVYDRPSAPAAAAQFQKSYVDLKGGYAGKANNYHYVGGPDVNQLIPLVSAEAGQWKRSSTGDPNLQEIVHTNLQGCHGTSGSGVMQQNPDTGMPELVGVAARGISSELLCGASEGDSLGYTNVGEVQYLMRDEVSDCEAGRFASSVFFGFFCDRTWLDKIRSFNINWQIIRPVCLSCPPWLQPVRERTAIFASGERFEVPFAARTAGKRYRASARVLTNAPGATVKLWMGPRLLASHTMGAPGTEWLAEGVGSVMLSASFLADAQSAGALAVTTEAPGGVPMEGPYGGPLTGVDEIVMVPDASLDLFANADGRLGVGLLDRKNPAATIVSMRFVGDGKDGYAALLHPGERMVVTRQALIAGRSVSLAVIGEGNSPLTCGLLMRDGSERTVPCRADGAAVLLTPPASSHPMAYYVDNPGTGSTVTIDEVATHTTRGACALLADDTTPFVPDHDTFAFQGQAGQKVTVSLVTGNGLAAPGNAALSVASNPYISLPMGSDDGTLPGKVTVTLPTTREYYIGVVEGTWAGYKGEYCVSVSGAGGEVAVRRDLFHE